MSKIAEITISKADAMEKYCSVERLCATRQDKDGPLRRILDWIRTEEGGREFKLQDGKVRRLRFGGDADDFVILYYYKGKRYKVCKDGRAFVSSADPEDTCEGVEEDLQSVIDTVLNDEIRAGIAEVMEGIGGRMAKTKVIDDVDDRRRQTVVGIVVSDGRQAGA